MKKRRRQYPSVSLAIVCDPLLCAVGKFMPIEVRLQFHVDVSGALQVEKVTPEDSSAPVFTANARPPEVMGSLAMSLNVDLTTAGPNQENTAFSIRVASPSGNCVGAGVNPNEAGMPAEALHAVPNWMSCTLTNH